MLDTLIRWAGRHDPVRAMLLTSTRAIPGADVDRFSDYDVVLVLADLNAFLTDEGWLRELGDVLTMFRDDGPFYDGRWYTRLVLYADGTKIDFSLWTVAIMRQIVASSALPDSLDVGYRVLLDKDGLTRDLPPPTFQAHIPPRPTQEAFTALVEEFWWESTYVAKNLWRGELMPARYSLDNVMKHQRLRQLLEWRVEIDHDWALKPGVQGKGLKKLLPPETWAALAATYTGPDLDDNWAALFGTTDLFQQVAVEVAAALGFTYPHALDRRVSAYLRRVRDMAR